MGRYEIIPGTQRFVCGGDSRYGMVRVRDTQDAAHPEFDARVDMSWDASHHAHITLPNGTTEDIDDPFLGAYRGLQNVTGGGNAAQQAYCHDMHADAPAAPEAAPASRRTPTSGWWLVPNVLLRGVNYTLRLTTLQNLRTVSPDASLTGTLGGVGLGLDVATTGLHIATTPGMDDATYFGSNGVLLGWGLVHGVLALTMQNAYRGTALHEFAAGTSDALSTPGYRYLGGWGGAIEVGLGGVLIGTSFLIPQPQVLTPSDMAVPSSIPPGSRNVPGNLLDTSGFPGGRLDFIGVGSGHVLNGIIGGIYWSQTHQDPTGRVPRVSITTLPEGGVYGSVTGRF